MCLDADATADHARAHKLQAAQSLAMLEEPLVASGSLEDCTNDPVDDSSLSLQLSVRRGRLALLVGLVTCVVVALTLLLWRGTELKRFTREELSISDQEKLLDQYNSYSGNVASALGRPLEVFLALMAQVVVLWLMTDAVLSVNTSWRVKLAVLGLGATVGFLLTNGLNALNVQVRELPLTLVMSSSDMSVQSNSSGTSSSTVEKTFPESSPQNPTTNTILRGLLLTHAPIASICANRYYSMASDSVSFGMPQQPWMKHLIPEALPGISARIDLLTNDTSEAVQNFPMDASVAADLLLAGYNARDDYSPVSRNTTFDIEHKPRQKYFANSSVTNQYAPTTRLMGLLPNDSSSSEAQKREWFLSRSVGFIHNATLPEFQNASLTRWTMMLSRVDITSSVWVDAITVESEVARMDLKHRLINGSRYYKIDDYRTFIRDNNSPDAKIDAFAVCNKSGIDGISTSFFPSGETDYMFCDAKSTTAMYVFSSGRRLEAEAVYDDSVVAEVYNDRNTSELDMTNLSDLEVIKDLRYVYSTTFARINWRLKNLSEAYGAACHDDGGCMGLDANLTSTQQLLVRANALPIDQVVTVAFNEGLDMFSPQLPVEVVAVRRPASVQAFFRSKFKSSDADTVSWLGDVLLRHNIRNLAANDSVVLGEQCVTALDRRVRNYVNNHIYMETTLQATYTAAAFFLFQNGIAHDVLNQSATSSSSGVPLKLDQNIQQMSVRLSIPGLNAALTLAGCVLLVVALLVALASSPIAAGADNPSVQDPHQIARVMVDDTTFPSMLLKRRVIHKGVEGDADAFLISALSVGPQERSTEATPV